jgi:hypothetical protein
MSALPTDYLSSKARQTTSDKGRLPFKAPSETPMVFGAAAKSVEYSDRIRAHYREARRIAVEIPCTVEIVLMDGSIYDSGTAVLRNISPSGALVSSFNIPGGNFPAALFKLRMVLKGDPYAGIGIEATPVRFAAENYGIGVKFDEIFVAV